MTTPPGDELRDQQQEADAALEKAEEIKQRSKGLGEQWKRSRADNNFRNMVRGLVSRSE